MSAGCVSFSSITRSANKKPLRDFGFLQSDRRRQESARWEKKNTATRSESTYLPEPAMFVRLAWVTDAGLRQVPR